MTAGLSDMALGAAARAAARRALAEDLAGFGDLAGRAFGAPGRARVEARADGVLSGVAPFAKPPAWSIPTFRSLFALDAGARFRAAPRWPHWPAGSRASSPSSAPA